MATEFQVNLKNQPGTLAQLCTLLGDARVNIDALQGFSDGAESRVQFVPNDADKAAKTLETAGIAFTQREVLIMEVLDQPGMLGDIALIMSDAGINIDSIYVTATGHIVFGVDDLHGAIQVTDGMAVRKEC
jgi:hypothetical protein